MKKSSKSLASLRPDLAVQALFNPNDVAVGSHDFLEWKCDEGHRWHAEVRGRVKGNGCPYCSNKKVLAGYNDLKTLNPELAAQALFDPSTVSIGSGKRLPWQCVSGHRWVTSVAERSQGRGCPFCSGRKVLQGYNDLGTTHPHLVADARFDVTKFSAGSGKYLPWECSQGHSWTASPGARSKISGGTGCPICSGNAIQVGFNDLATTHPELVTEALFDTFKVSAGSGFKGKWRCEMGHEWDAVVKSRVSGRGCPYCAGNQMLTGFNDLATLFPLIAREALFDASKVHAYTKKKMSWRCASGHGWESEVGSRTSGGRGCPVCSSNEILVGETDLATRFPEIAKEALFDPTSVAAFSSVRKSWRCNEGHEWITSVASRSSGYGCPYCSGNKVLSGFNDLATTDPDLAKEALFDPTMVGRGSHKKLPWRCALGHEWEANVSNRAFHKTGCVYCTGRKALPGFNDLASRFPDLAEEAMFDATKFTAGSSARKRWLCVEGHEWLATVYDRVKGSGCPNCAKFGYHNDQEGWVYLMEQLDWGMLQIGITNDIKRRASEHKKHGWELLDVRGPMDGLLAQELERDLLRFLSEGRGVKLSASTSSRPDYAGKPGKRGEAWQTEQHEVEKIYELIQDADIWIQSEDK